MNGTTYMFFEWKSGDYIHHAPQALSTTYSRRPRRHQRGLEKGWAKLPSDKDFNRDLPAKVAQLDIAKAGLEDVVKVFGEPGQYVWGSKEFQRGQLPDRYIMIYPASFSIFMRDGQIVELRFNSPATDSRTSCRSDPASTTC